MQLFLKVSLTPMTLTIVSENIHGPFQLSEIPLEEALIGTRFYPVC